MKLRFAALAFASLVLIIPHILLGQEWMPDIKTLSKISKPCLRQAHRADCIRIISSYHDLNIGVIETAALEIQEKELNRETAGVLLTTWGAIATVTRLAAFDYLRMASGSLEKGWLHILTGAPAGNFADLRDVFAVSLISGKEGRTITGHESLQTKSFLRVEIKNSKQVFLIPSELTKKDIFSKLLSATLEGIYKGLSITGNTIYELRGDNVYLINVEKYYTRVLHSDVRVHAIARAIIAKIKFRIGERIALAESLIGNAIRAGMEPRLYLSAIRVGSAYLLGFPWDSDQGFLNLLSDINATCTPNSELGCFTRYEKSHSISGEDLQKIFDAVVILALEE